MRLRPSASRTAVVALAALALLAAGCAAPPRRAPEPRTDTTPAAPAPVLDFAALQDRFAQFIKGVGVPGFRRADTIVIGNAAVIGLDIDRAAAGAPAPGVSPVAPGAAAPGAPPGATTAPGALPPGTTTAPGGATTPGAGTVGAPAPGAGVATAPGAARPGAGAPAAPGAAGPGATAPTAPGTVVPSAAADPARMVAERVMAGNLGVTRAIVTTDPSLVARIQRLVQDLRGGVAATDRVDEIAAIVKAVRGPAAPAATTPAGAAR